MEKTIEQVQEKYDLELDKIISEIKEKKAKLVLLQFPDAIKPYATVIVDYLERALKGSVDFLIWFGSCYGACDVPVPVELERLEPTIDLVIQFGHNEMMPDY